MSAQFTYSRPADMSGMAMTITQPSASRRPHDLWANGEELGRLPRGCLSHRVNQGTGFIRPTLAQVLDGPTP